MSLGLLVAHGHIQPTDWEGMCHKWMTNSGGISHGAGFPKAAQSLEIGFPGQQLNKLMAAEQNAMDLRVF